MADENTLSKNAQAVLDSVEKLTVLELAELVKAMEDKFGVSAAAPVAVAAAGAAAPAEEAEAKDSFDVELTAAGDNKLGVIKALREVLPELGLADAKGVAEAAPKVIKEGLKKDEAEAAKAKLEEAGATVTLK